MLRSIKTLSRIRDAGYRCNSVRQYHTCARLLDEGKGGSAPIEVTSVIESSATSGELKERDLKLDTHKQSENSETLSKKGSGETIQNRSRSVVKKGESDIHVYEYDYHYIYNTKSDDTTPQTPIKLNSNIKRTGEEESDIDDFEYEYSYTYKYTYTGPSHQSDNVNDGNKHQKPSSAS